MRGPADPRSALKPDPSPNSDPDPNPDPNPLKAATIVRAPDSEKSANGGVEWSCSSCFFYAVRGRTEGAPPLVEGPALLSALKKLAKHHKKTQTPSEVP